MSRAVFFSVVVSNKDWAGGEPPGPAASLATLRRDHNVHRSRPSRVDIVFCSCHPPNFHFLTRRARPLSVDPRTASPSALSRAKRGRTPGEAHGAGARAPSGLEQSLSSDKRGGSPRLHPLPRRGARGCRPIGTQAPPTTPANRPQHPHQSARWRDRCLDVYRSRSDLGRSSDRRRGSSGPRALPRKTRESAKTHRLALVRARLSVCRVIGVGAALSCAPSRARRGRAPKRTGWRPCARGSGSVE